MNNLFTKFEQNVFELLNKIGKHISLQVYLVFGGVKIPTKIKECKRTWRYLKEKDLGLA